MVLSETSNGQTSYYWQGLDTLAQSDGTTPQYFQYDGLGSVRQLTDSAGSVSLAQTFDPYGNPYAKADTATSNLGFTGEQTDSNGFVFLRARYYNPAQGGFFQTDPSRMEQNYYEYVTANPIGFTDPSGLILQSEAQAADNLRGELLEQWNIDARKDYGTYQPGYRGSVAIAKEGECKWEEGTWKLEDLTTIRDTVLFMSWAFGGNARFKQLMGWPVITMYKDSSNNGKYGGLTDPVKHTVTFPTGQLVPAWNVAHELGHVWDFSSGSHISNRLVTYTHGSMISNSDKATYWRTICGASVTVDSAGNVTSVIWDSSQTWRVGCNSAGYKYGDKPPAGSDKNFNPQEDWAESVAAFVFPADARGRSARTGQPSLTYTDFFTILRGKYVQEVLNGTEPK
jgi:RHS repeat-associated protein